MPSGLQEDLDSSFMAFVSAATPGGILSSRVHCGSAAHSTDTSHDARPPILLHPLMQRAHTWPCQLHLAARRRGGMEPAGPPARRS